MSIQAQHFRISSGSHCSLLVVFIVGRLYVWSSSIFGRLPFWIRSSSILDKVVFYFGWGCLWFRVGSYLILGEVVFHFGWGFFQFGFYNCVNASCFSSSIFYMRCGRTHITMERIGSTRLIKIFFCTKICHFKFGTFSEYDSKKYSLSWNYVSYFRYYMICACKAVLGVDYPSFYLFYL